MPFLFELLIRGTILAAIAIAITRLGLSIPRPARAAMLTVLLVWLTGLPLLVATAPRLSIAILPVVPLASPGPLTAADLLPLATEPIPPGPATTSVAPEPSRPPSQPERLPIPIAGYLTIAGLIVGCRLMAAHRVRRLVADATGQPTAALAALTEEVAARLGITSPEVRISARAALPFVAGLTRPIVVFPAESAGWGEERLRLVLLHELAHVRRHDLVAIAVADLACAVNWFNPLVWIAARQLRLEAEVASDGVVVDAGIPAERYATELLYLARRANGIPLLSPILEVGAISGLRERVRWILEDDRPRGSGAKLTGAVVAGCLVSLGAAFCEPVAAQGDPVAPARWLNISDGGPEISSNGAGLQARWNDGGRHAAMFLTGAVDLADAGAGLVRGDGAILLLEEQGDGLDVFEWRLRSDGLLPTTVRRTLAVGARQLGRLSGNHTKGLPGSTLTGLPALSDDPTATIIQAGWLDGRQRYGLALRGHWQIVDGVPTTTDRRAWFVGYQVDPRSGASRRLQISRVDGGLVTRQFRDGAELPVDEGARRWAAATLAAVQRMAPEVIGRP